MIPAACKRLIEVDFPIARVSEHAAQRYECGIVTGQICLTATVSTFPAARRPTEDYLTFSQLSSLNHQLIGIGVRRFSNSSSA